jgi:hypothetical protein
MRVILAALLLAGCTHGVDVVERQVKASHPGDGIAIITADLAVEGGVTVRGGGDSIDGVMDVVAWLSPGDSARFLDQVKLRLDASGDRLAVVPDYAGFPTEQIVLEDLALAVPAAADLDLALGHGDAAIAEVDGFVKVTADGSVDLDRTGPVDVVAAGVTAAIGRGGRIESASDDVVIDVLGTDFEALVVTTTSGWVTIHLPPGQGWVIDLSTGGENATATANLGGFTCGGVEQPCDDARFGAGGPLIRVESSSGTVSVDDG